MNPETFIKSAMQQFKEYKTLADKTFEQIPETFFSYTPNDASNSIAVIITHLYGNMLSRWTNFLTEDGEKEWRKRDEEFDKQILSKNELLKLWDQGWNTLFNTLEHLQPEDLDKTVYIRTKPLTVVEAIHRQLTHYASHVGQIIYIAKFVAGDNWQSLSISKGASKAFNEKMKHSQNNL